MPDDAEQAATNEADAAACNDEGVGRVTYRLGSGFRIGVGMVEGVACGEGNWRMLLAKQGRMNW